MEEFKTTFSHNFNGSIDELNRPVSELNFPYFKQFDMRKMYTWIKAAVAGKLIIYMTPCV